MAGGLAAYPLLKFMGNMLLCILPIMVIWAPGLWTFDMIGPGMPGNEYDGGGGRIKGGCGGPWP
jgi:hypothetical protein